MATKPLYIRATTQNHFDEAQSKPIFAERLKSEPGLQRLAEEGVAQGFEPRKGKQRNWGTNASWTASDDSTVAYEMYVESYARDADEACLMTETITSSDGNSATYHSFLIAPRGDFKKVKEYYLGPRNKVLLAKSKWTRFRKCVTNRCGGPCVVSLVSCSGSWAAYLACVALVCGGCMGGCGACALCNCKWWCKKITGCCRD